MFLLLKEKMKQKGIKRKYHDNGLLSFEAVAQNQTLRLWHIDDNGIREEVKNFKIIEDTIQFETPSFSVFEVDNGTPPLRTYYFEIPENPFENTNYKAYYFPTSSTEINGNYKNLMCAS